MISSLIKKFTQFSIVGVIITVTSLVSSFFFLKIIGTPLFITYIINYTVMISLSYLLNAHFVFKVKYSIKHLILYYLSYLVGMVVGLILLKVFNEIFSLENWILSYMVIPFTMLCNFTLSNKILK